MRSSLSPSHFCWSKQRPDGYIITVVKTNKEPEAVTQGDDEIRRATRPCLAALPA